jgi:hypothetical protein
MIYKDPHSEFNRILQNIFLLFVFLLKNFKFFSKYFIALGYSFKLIDFAKHYNFDSNFEQGIFVGLRREKIYEEIIKKINIENNNIELVLEFGVAWGYSTNYFLSNIKKNISWYGFDSFFGLPSNWQEYKKGHFGTQGKPPRIDDHRLTWNIGNIENTLDIYLKGNEELVNKKKFIIFDFDLFDPTEYTLQKISKYLNKGDILYFDEPNTIDEMTILYRLMALNKKKIKVLYYTPCQIAVEILSNNVNY